MICPRKQQERLRERERQDATSTTTAVADALDNCTRKRDDNMRL